MEVIIYNEVQCCSGRVLRPLPSIFPSSTLFSDEKLNVLSRKKVLVQVLVLVLVLATLNYKENII